MFFSISIELFHSLWHSNQTILLGYFSAVEMFPILSGAYLEMMASAKETTDIILVANGGNHAYKPFKNRDLIFDAQVPVLGNSVFHHSFIKVAELM